MLYKNQLQERITLNQSRLNDLKLRRTHQGWSVDPAIIAEIQRIEQEVSHLRRQLRRLASPFIQRSNRLYRYLLTFYPTSFQREFGPEMISVFYCQCREAYVEQWIWGLIRVWTVTLVLLPGSAWQEHRAVWRQRPELHVVSPQQAAKDDDVKALLYNLPGYLYEVFLNFIAFGFPGGILSSVLFSFFLGGMVAVIFNNMGWGVVFALLFIPSVLLLVLLGALSGALLYGLILFLRRLFTIRDN